ncbi:type II toxin-antitoxin system VapC family toxin [Acidianus sp. HS-5]|uniref:type II toxin-antitoxin system VapC family toxin n=1 Tax=Acidianus sp. HS-5 TaxID=2886040 RepID=UPI003211BD19
MSEGIEKKIYDTNTLIEIYKNRVLLSRLNHVITSILNVIEYPPILKLGDKLIVIYPSKDDYELAIKIMIKLRKIGEPVNVVDIILASIAINRNMIVVTNDKGFESIRKVEENLKIESISF